MQNKFKFQRQAKGQKETENANKEVQNDDKK